MMHQFNEGKVVISTEKLVGIEGINFIKKYKHIYIYNTFSSKKIIAQIGEERCVKYLDDFIIVLPENYLRQWRIWDDFYSYYGNDYEKMIDVDCNIKCIKFLYSHIKSNLAGKKSIFVLDYGCGSGLAYFIDKKLIGYEPNEKMRMQAIRKGMQVLNYSQLCSLPNKSVDGIFASFVFHMGLQEREILILKRILREDGVIVANYYKNMNSLMLNKLFMKNGFSFKRLNGLEEMDGSVYEYRKL